MWWCIMYEVGKEKASGGNGFLSPILSEKAAGRSITYIKLLEVIHIQFW